MKTKPEGSEEERLGKLLHEWRVEGSMPPHFQEQVWRRIERAQVGNRIPIWMGLQRWLNVVLPKPKFALAYVTVLAILGVTAGAIAGQIRDHQVDRRLGERYVQAVDPYRSDGGIR